MIDGYQIRLALPQDTAVLPSIEGRAAKLFENLMEETGITREALARVTPVEDFEQVQRAGRLWVAESPTGELVGFALVHDLGGTPHLEELDVLPEHGGRGLGSRLLAEVCGWAREAGYPKVTLSTFRAVPWNAPFYQRRGFRIVDPAELSEELVQLVQSEKERGLRIDLRVVMEYRIQAG